MSLQGPLFEDERRRPLGTMIPSDTNSHDFFPLFPWRLLYAMAAQQSPNEMASAMQAHTYRHRIPPQTVSGRGHLGHPNLEQEGLLEAAARSIAYV